MATVKISELPTGQNIGMPSNAAVNFSSTTSGAGAKDVGIARGAAGNLKITNGAGGDAQMTCQTIDFGSIGSLTIRGAGASGQFQLGSNGQIQWWSGTTIGSLPQDTSIHRYAAGVVRFGDASTGIRGLQGGGTAVASAAALPLPTGSVFHVTGTTNVTSITSTNFAAGCQITLIFDDVLTFTDGNNLKLAGNFVTSADDTITLVYDGTNWYEMCRSVN